MHQEPEFVSAQDREDDVVQETRENKWEVEFCSAIEIVALYFCLFLPPSERGSHYKREVTTKEIHYKVLHTEYKKN